MAAKPVVVGVDGSEPSLLAVDWAAREAKRRKAPLRIVSAPAMPPRMRPGREQTVASEIEESYEQALTAAVSRSKQAVPDLVVETGLLSGPPAVALAESGSGAQLVVMGDRGMGGFAALLLGSVSRYVATHAPCPAVVVREQGYGGERREIAVGVRDPVQSAAALAFAFEEAALRGAILVAVHSWYSHLPGDHETIAAEASQALEEALPEWSLKYPSVVVQPDVPRGHPGQVLVDYSARTDLVVIGRRGSGGGRGPAVGSIQHALLNHARGPVAVVPSDT
jgi:nucleotide-binding universal stress UspA family protein